MAHPFNQHRDYITPDVAANPKLRELILHHADYLRKHPLSKTVPVDANMRSLDLYDFYRFMKSVGYPNELHYVIMLINNIPSHMHFDTKVDQLIIPDSGVVEDIISIAEL
ncbi:MAG: hypothetical protein ACRDDY_13925 [Clostridium sp.]|uniref:hypothetical protein n=1 Tax=Clostridium sp. TaxID=1506 RepID=UPI003EE5BCF6